MTVADELEIAVELDNEWAQVRLWREQQMVKAGVNANLAYRLALLPDLDYRRVVHLKEIGMSEEQIFDEYLD